jgi:hypothetical protein
MFLSHSTNDSKRNVFMLVWSLAWLGFFGFYLPNIYKLYVGCHRNTFIINVVAMGNMGWGCFF